MKALKNYLIAIALMLGATVSLRAQSGRDVSGTVMDEQNQPVAGAAVIVPGGSGEITGLDGTFSIRIPEGDVVLEVSCLGYKTTQVTVKASQAKVAVTLAEDSMLLDETVVVGYGTQKKVNLTGAISVVDDKELKDRSSHNLVTMLQGSVPGLNISTSSGNPGSSGSLNIRGFTSINESSPIVLVDGALGDLEDVNPNDVQSISVIKDAAAAAVYGARAAYGVILVTTKSGSEKDGKATIRYSGRFGWEEPTTSTDYESRGYWSVYALDTFWKTQSAGTAYTTYTEADMAQLLARVNDKTENPDRPWVVQEVRNGQNQWVYYGNYDWYHELFTDRNPVQQQSVSVSGGNKSVKYFVSGGYDRQEGISQDVYTKYNLRAKIDAKLNKYMRLSNNTSFYNSEYDYIGAGSVQDTFQYLRHTTAAFPLYNPDGNGLYSTPMIRGSYNVANGRHIILTMGKHVNAEKKFNFANTTELVITPTDHFNLTANFTYRKVTRDDMHRSVNVPYSIRPGVTGAYTTGAGLDELTERYRWYNYYTGNIFGTYENKFANAHNVKLMLGFNVETYNYKNVTATAQNLADETLNDFSLVVPDESGATITTLTGGQSEYALAGFFGRANYDYKGRYLVEFSGRYDGSSRFASGHRWGFFPSASGGWRISEEPFFAPAKHLFDNLKLRASIGTLGNQNVSNYAFLRTISITDFSSYSFGEGSSAAQYSYISAPNSDSLTWETTYQYNIGLDFSMLGGKLTGTAEAYIRDTKDMLVQGTSLPSVYGADSPKENAADLRTRGYELSLNWRDGFDFLGHTLTYSVKGSLSNYDSYITRYDNNPNKVLNDYYEGMRIGDIWGFVVDGLFETDEEAQYYQENVVDALTYIGTNRMVGGFLAGDLRYVDLDNKQEGPNGINQISLGSNTADDPGDRKIIGNSLPSLQYGLTLSFEWNNIDFSTFFQGTGNHYWYPSGMNYAFWGMYSYAYYTAFLPTNYMSTVWSEDNKDAYFPRPRVYSSTGGELAPPNTRYLQNVRYLRWKNLTVGYTLPSKVTDFLHLSKVRVFFSGENLEYWSPIKKYTKYLDPESAYRRTTTTNSNGLYTNSSASDAVAYPWLKTYMFGIDITF